MESPCVGLGERKGKERGRRGKVRGEGGRKGRRERGREKGEREKEGMGERERGREKEGEGKGKRERGGGKGEEGKGNIEQRDKDKWEVGPAWFFNTVTIQHMLCMLCAPLTWWGTSFWGEQHI